MFNHLYLRVIFFKYHVLFCNSTSPQMSKTRLKHLPETRLQTHTAVFDRFLILSLLTVLGPTDRRSCPPVPVFSCRVGGARGGCLNIMTLDISVTQTRLRLCSRGCRSGCLNTLLKAHASFELIEGLWATSCLARGLLSPSSVATVYDLLPPFTLWVFSYLICQICCSKLMM